MDRQLHMALCRIPKLPIIIAYKRQNQLTLGGIAVAPTTFLGQHEFSQMPSKSTWATRLLLLTGHFLLFILENDAES